MKYLKTFEKPFESEIKNYVVWSSDKNSNRCSILKKIYYNKSKITIKRLYLFDLSANNGMNVDDEDNI